MPKPAPSGLSKQRLEALSDGIFAIVMTLLTFELKAPILTGLTTDAALAQRLMAMGPKFFAYVVSFVMLGIYWSGHHNQYHFIVRTDRRFQWVNLGLLCVIALVPFSAATLGEYPMLRLASIIYGANLVLIGLMLFAHWRYAYSRGLVDPRRVDADLIRMVSLRCLKGPVAYAIAIAMAFIHPAISLAIYVLTPLYFLFPNAIDRYWQITPESNAAQGPSR